LISYRLYYQAFWQVLAKIFFSLSGISFALTPVTRKSLEEAYVSEQPEERQWYTVYSKPQKEEFARSQLHLKGLEVFLPKLLLPNSSKKRKRIVPLFPNYLFTRINIHSAEYGYTIWSPGVKRIVSFNGTPAPIDSDIVDYLMKQTNAEGLIPARSNLRIGQEIRISGGPFDGLTGIIQEPPNAKGRVRVLLTLLNRPTKAEVPVDLVDSGWVGANA
jgi:transcription elongation factor/antiterminator RfaH